MKGPERRMTMKNIMQERNFYRGVNLGGWFSQCDYSKERLDHFIVEADFEKIASWGLDHVRIPVDYNILENKDGGFDQSGFDRIEAAVGLAKKYGLNAIIDLHKTAGFSFDEGEAESGFFESAKYQERFFALWEELARQFGKNAGHVAFELLNEVTEQRFCEQWNRICEQCIARIRKYAPDTLILVGSYWNNSAEAVKDLAAPYDDKVVYNFHCYSPLEFTHQGAYWVKELTDKSFSFEELDITPAYFEKLHTEALQKAADNGTCLYCGEYGVIDRVAPEDAVKWFRVIHSVFEKYGISRAAWSYKEMDFGISDSRMDGVREELLQYL